MKIGIDASPLVKVHGGVSYYLFHHLDEIIKQRDDCHFYLYAASEQGDIAHFKRYPNVTICPSPLFNTMHSLWAQTTLSYKLILDKIDLFWGATQSLPLIKNSRMKTIITLYDFVYRICPETSSRYKRLYLQLFCPTMLKRSDYILPISAGSGARLKELYNLPYYAVVQPPIKKIEQANPNATPYILTIGTLEPRKNLEMLIHFYIRLLEKHGTTKIPPLLLAGGGGWNNKSLLDLLDEATTQYPDHIKRLGYVDETQLAILTASARYSIMFSLYEGYGMPLAEARASHTPVICFDSPELREAAENDGIFLSPTTWEEELEAHILASPHTPKEIVRPTYLTNAEKIIPFLHIIDEVKHQQ